MDPTFDASRYIVRARRLADLSQRQLADRLGLSHALVGRLETGRSPVATPVLARILALAGLRLAVVDARGEPVAPFPRDVVRDNAGRRFPAHLDVAPPEDEPPFRRQFPRYDRMPAKGWYHLRAERDQLRDDSGTASDHPTVVELARYSEEVRAARRARRRRPVRPTVHEECSCEVECWEGGPCVPECGCQCESTSAGRGGLA